MATFRFTKFPRGLRSRIMPINDAYPIGTLLDAYRDYLEVATRDFITFEYLMPEGVNDLPAAKIIDGQVFNRQHNQVRGSNTSRSPSPRRLKANTVTRIAVPGNRESHQAIWR